jgi:hypothetical protein
MKLVTVLLTFPVLKIEQMSLIQEALGDDLRKHGLEASILFSPNRKNTLERLVKPEHPYDLLISHLNLPARENSVPEATGGLTLVQILRKKGILTPAILLSDFVDVNLQGAIDSLERCQILIEGGQDWETKLIGRCREILLTNEVGRTGTEKKLSGKVDIYIDIEHTPLGSYQMTGPAGFNVPNADLILNAWIMKDLVQRSKNVIHQRRQDWEKELKAIGTYLLHEFFMQNYNFSQEFKELLHRAGGEENVRIRFVVEKTVHPIALEALIDEKEDFWMLHAPIYRTVQVDAVKSTLFSDDFIRERHPINCLIIEAEADGIVNIQGKELTLGRLKNVHKEGAFLSRFLKNKAADFGIARVERLGAKGPKGSSLEKVRTVLTEQGPWELVHFSGHSHYDDAGDKGKGYVFFPGETGPEALEIDNFAQFLRYKADTRFVYLSSCESSAADFTFALAKQGIPAIVGFRWEIDDDKAAEYAEIFYRILFEKSKKLEYAFLETRKKMYEKYQDNRIWAAAILIIQVDEP